MEKWEKDIIRENLDKLIHITKVNETVLAKFQASGILSDNDIKDLKVHCKNPIKQASEFYDLIQSRILGYQILLKALSETNQSGALSILTSIPLNYVNSFRYDENSRLGKGAFATVFRGEFNGRAVAVKRIFSTDEHEKARINNEIEILKLIDEHPNIVQSFSSQLSAHFVLIVLELCDMTLKEWVRKKYPIQIPQREVLRQITEGLNWLHKQNILYRGVRPENVLLKERTKIVKISGFGLSTRFEDDNQLSVVTASELEENLGWEAPELASNLIMQKQNLEDDDRLKCVFASDVYSLGCMFFYVLTDGENNFEDLNDWEELEDGLENNDCIQDIRIIRQMISKDSESRPSCSALLMSPTVQNTSANVVSSNQLVSSIQCESPILAYMKKMKMQKKIGQENEDKLHKPWNEFNQHKFEAKPTETQLHRMVFGELDKCKYAIEHKQRTIELMEKEREESCMKHNKIIKEMQGNELEMEIKKHVTKMEKSKDIERSFKMEVKLEMEKMIKSIKKLKQESVEIENKRKIIKRLKQESAESERRAEIDRMGVMQKMADCEATVKMLRQKLEDEAEKRRHAETKREENDKRAEVQRKQENRVSVEMQRLEIDRVDLMQKTAECEILVKMIREELDGEATKRRHAKIEKEKIYQKSDIAGYLKEKLTRGAETKRREATAREDGKMSRRHEGKREECTIV